MIRFTKAIAAGNDFIIVDNRGKALKDNSKSTFAKKVCDRKRSVGADGVLLLENSKKCDFKMSIFNPEENGLRCSGLIKVPR